MKNNRRKTEERTPDTEDRHEDWILLVLLLVSLLLCLLWPVRAAPVQAATDDERTVVQVAAESIAQQDRLTLGDVAEVLSKDPEIVTRLRTVALGYAPNVGVVREIARERLLLAIAAAGFADGTIRLESPTVIHIRRAAQIVDPGLIREAVERVTISELNASGATARLTRLDLPPAVEVPAGSIEARASMSGVRDLFSPFIVFIELWQEGRVVQRFSTTAQVEAFAPIIVATRELIASTRLRQDCFKVEVKRLGRSLNNYVTDPERLRGMSVRRTVGRGEALMTELLTAELVIRPGDQVRIIGESGSERGFQVIVNGEARAAGRIGDRIQVRNLQSGAMLQAVVADEGVVRIRF